jgi:hypothetical protein
MIDQRSPSPPPELAFDDYKVSGSVPAPNGLIAADTPATRRWIAVPVPISSCFRLGRFARWARWKAPPLHSARRWASDHQGPIMSFGPKAAIQAEHARP